MNGDKLVHDYLLTLERYPTTPTCEVERRLRDKGRPVVESGLAFHVRYDGYREELGQD